MDLCIIALRCVSVEVHAGRLAGIFYDFVRIYFCM